MMKDFDNQRYTTKLTDGVTQIVGGEWGTGGTELNNNFAVTDSNGVKVSSSWRWSLGVGSTRSSRSARLDLNASHDRPMRAAVDSCATDPRPLRLGHEQARSRSRPRFPCRCVQRYQGMRVHCARDAL